MITRYSCPIGSCPWTHDAPAPEAPHISEAVGATIEEAAFTAVRTHLMRVESVLNGHLETHTLLEWVQEIDRLQRERQREDRDARLVTAVLLRRLSGVAEITDAELADEDVHGMLVRYPVTGGFRLGVLDRVVLPGADGYTIRQPYRW